MEDRTLRRIAYPSADMNVDVGRLEQEIRRHFGVNRGLIEGRSQLAQMRKGNQR